MRMYVTWCDVILVYTVVLLQAIFLFSGASYEVGVILRVLTSLVVAYLVSSLISRYERIRHINKLMESLSENHREKINEAYEKFLDEHPEMRKKGGDEDE